MTPGPPSPPLAPPPTSPTPAPRKKKRWLLLGCGTLLALIVIIVATVAITLWWIQRPIKPVVLSTQEKALVDDKLRQVHARSSEPPASSPSGTISRPSANVVRTNQEPDRPYVPGSKTLKLTEREINGLLNANTDLGNSVRLEFGRDAINAYVAVPIPKDFPVGGGKTFRARGRFRLSLSNDGAPYAILEDVTVFGVSLPKAWLGGLKGQNLLEDATRSRSGDPVLRGIKSLRVEPGALVLELED